MYQTALMKGLLGRLPAADPLDPDCVFTINPPLCLQRATSSSPPPPPPALPHPPPSTQTATFTGASSDSPRPVTLTQPPTKAPAHIRTLSMHCTRSCAHTRSYVTRRTCRTTQIRSVNVHILCSKTCKTADPDLQRCSTHLHANRDQL